MDRRAERPREIEDLDEVEVVDEKPTEPAEGTVRTGDVSSASASSSSCLTQPIGSSGDFRPGGFSAVTSAPVVT